MFSFRRLFYINYEEFKDIISTICLVLGTCFILTMRNLKIIKLSNKMSNRAGFILTMRNLKNVEHNKSYI